MTKKILKFFCIYLLLSIVTAQNQTQQMFCAPSDGEKTRTVATGTFDEIPNQNSTLLRAMSLEYLSNSGQYFQTLNIVFKSTPNDTILLEVLNSNFTFNTFEMKPQNNSDNKLTFIDAISNENLNKAFMIAKEETPDNQLVQYIHYRFFINQFDDQTRDFFFTSTEISKDQSSSDWGIHTTPIYNLTLEKIIFTQLGYQTISIWKNQTHLSVVQMNNNDGFPLVLYTLQLDGLDINYGNRYVLYDDHYHNFLVADQNYTNYQLVQMSQLVSFASNYSFSFIPLRQKYFYIWGISQDGKKGRGFLNTEPTISNSTIIVNDQISGFNPVWTFTDNYRYFIVIGNDVQATVIFSGDSEQVNYLTPNVSYVSITLSQHVQDSEISHIFPDFIFAKSITVANYDFFLLSDVNITIYWIDQRDPFVKVAQIALEEKVASAISQPIGSGEIQLSVQCLCVVAQLSRFQCFGGSLKCVVSISYDQQDCTVYHQRQAIIPPPNQIPNGPAPS